MNTVRLGNLAATIAARLAVRTGTQITIIDPNPAYGTVNVYGWIQHPSKTLSFRHEGPTDESEFTVTVPRGSIPFVSGDFFSFSPGVCVVYNNVQYEVDKVEPDCSGVAFVFHCGRYGQTCELPNG